MAAAAPDPEGWRAQLAPPRPANPAGRVAVTELELFSICPRRYQLRHLLRLPEEGGPSEPEDREEADAAPGLSTGQLIHEVLRTLPVEAGVEHLPGRVRAAIRRQGVEDAGAGSAAEQTAIRLISGWLSTPRWKAICASADRRCELPFVLKLADGRRLVGRFDLLYRDEEGHWHVLDYKTDRVDGSAADHVAAHYALQQQAYGLAAARLLGPEAADVVFVFLRTGEEVSWRPTRPALAAAEACLGQAVALWAAALGSGEFPKTENSGRCVRCGYRALCGR